MNITFQGQYLSLTNFEWNNIPKFAVITGINGSGKSQLLELIHKSIFYNNNVFPTRIEIGEAEFRKGEVAFIPSEWRLERPNEMSLMKIQEHMKYQYDEFRKHHERRHDRPKLEDFFIDLEVRLGKSRKEITQKEFESHYRTDYYEEENKLPEQIARIFVDYHISMIDRLAKKQTEEEIIREIGPKPWKFLNEMMIESKLPFNFNSPEENEIRDTFILTITDTQRNCPIDFYNLSSGEKVLISIVFFLYNSSHGKFFPRFLLLDEPDAHLHPSMTKQFLDVLQNVLVREHGIRIIMTTHSPSTVALTPDDSLFVMRKTQPRIQKSTSKNKTISLLTSGLVIAGEGAKYILVEDDDDRKFYEEIYNHLNETNKISGEIPLVFIPVSLKNKSQTTQTGGKHQVYNWVKKFVDSGLDSIFQGIIDKDYGNPPAEGIKVLKRYSMENYLLDPIVVYAALMDVEKHPQIEGISIKNGEERKLRDLPKEQLQLIATTIHDAIFPILESESDRCGFSSNETNLEEVTLITGQKLLYPKWLLNRRGHTLLDKVYGKHYGNNVINLKALMKAFKKVHFIPIDLCDLYKGFESFDGTNVIS